MKEGSLLNLPVVNHNRNLKSKEEKIDGRSRLRVTMRKGASNLNSSRPTAPLRKVASNGFTVVELLTVVAIIAILIGIFIPAASTVRRSTLKAKTKSQFNQYAIAYEQFRAEYGFYPTMGSEGERFDLKGQNAVFIQTLSGRTREGKPISESYANRANLRGISFYQFSQSEISSDSTSNCSELVPENVIVDAFGNPNISILVDTDRDGTVRDPAGNTVNAGVLIFSSSRGCGDWKDVRSWE